MPRKTRRRNSEQIIRDSVRRVENATVNAISPKDLRGMSLEERRQMYRYWANTLQSLVRLTNNVQRFVPNVGMDARVIVHPPPDDNGDLSNLFMVPEENEPQAQTPATVFGAPDPDPDRATILKAEISTRIARMLLDAVPPETLGEDARTDVAVHIATVLMDVSVVALTLLNRGLMQENRQAAIEAAEPGRTLWDHLRDDVGPATDGVEGQHAHDEQHARGDQRG
jgi:hypothetical protein